MKSKWICVLIALLLSGGCFASCAADEPSIDETSGAVSQSQAAEDTGLKPDLPDIKLDGAEWNVYGYQDVLENSFFVEVPDDEVISEAIYASLMKIEDTYDVDITMTYSGLTEEAQSLAIKEMIDTGDTTFSLVEQHDAIGTGVAIEGYYYNLYDVPYLSLTTPWWHNIEDMSLNGNVFCITSDMSLVDIKNAWCLFFNKDIMDERKIEYPYQKVLDGEWTLEALIQMTKDVYEDLNRDNEINKGDLYGFECMLSMYGWLDSFGIQTTTKDENGRLTLMNDLEKVNDIVDTMYDWLHNSVGAKDSGQPNFSDSEGFMNGEYMIFMQALNKIATEFRYAEDLNYGILPMPKWDARDEYITSCLTYPFWIPIHLGAEELEVTGLLVEALSYQGYMETAPAY